MKPLLASLLALSSILWLTTNTADAHDSWANGRPIPAWVKGRCCSGNEAEDLGDVSRVHAIIIDDAVTGYKVDGFAFTVPILKVYPSQDGQVWAFYNNKRWVLDSVQPPDAAVPKMHQEHIEDTSDSTIYCLFVPCYSRPDLPPESELDSTCS